MTNITLTKKHLSELLTDYYIKTKLNKAEINVLLKKSTLPVNVPNETPKLHHVFRVTENQFAKILDSVIKKKESDNERI